MRALDDRGDAFQQRDIGGDLLADGGAQHLTTTSRPSCRVAACTWAMLAEASGIDVEAGIGDVDAAAQRQLDDVARHRHQTGPPGPAAG